MNVDRDDADPGRLQRSIQYMKTKEFWMVFAPVTFAYLAIWGALATFGASIWLAIMSGFVLSEGMASWMNFLEKRDRGETT